MQAVWDLANVMLSRDGGFEAVFPCAELTPFRRTTLADLIDKGFTPRSSGNSWSSEEVKYVSVRACYACYCCLKFVCSFSLVLVCILSVRCCPLVSCAGLCKVQQVSTPYRLQLCNVLS